MNEPIIDALIGQFMPHPMTGEAVIMYDHINWYDHMERDFCILEKTDCSRTGTSSSDSVSEELECPKIGKNKQCSEFSWSEINWQEDGRQRRFCVAPNTAANALFTMSALHDRNTCGDYGATRLWFRTSNAAEMFSAITSQLPTGKFTTTYRLP